MQAIRKEGLFEAKKAVLLEKLAYVYRTYRRHLRLHRPPTLTLLALQVLCVSGVYLSLDREATPADLDARKFTEFLHGVVLPYMKSAYKHYQEGAVYPRLRHHGSLRA